MTLEQARQLPLYMKLQIARDAELRGAKAMSREMSIDRKLIEEWMNKFTRKVKSKSVPDFSPLIHCLPPFSCGWAPEVQLKWFETFAKICRLN